jgi:glycosyltransferase involved in cell wall biosynthesis
MTTPEELVHITYLLGVKGNSLYDGKHAQGGRYHTYGQHSFILDLLRVLGRQGHEVRLVVDDLCGFALAPILREADSVSVSETVDPADKTDLILVDEASEQMLRRFPDEIPAFRIVHHPGRRSSEYLAARCARFICMTERGVGWQDAYLPPGKAVLARQGVDLDRFPEIPREGGVERPRVLVYCRMDSEREALVPRVIEGLDRRALLVYVVGDGPGFWEISDRFGSEIILINHVPCHSIPNLLGEMDVAVSVGRGAMEAMASGVPAICAGYSYAGLVTEANVDSLMVYNLTGKHSDGDPADVMADVRDALRTDRHSVRKLAENCFSADHFASRVSEIYSEI